MFFVAVWASLVAFVGGYKRGTAQNARLCIFIVATENARASTRTCLLALPRVGEALATNAADFAILIFGHR